MPITFPDNKKRFSYTFFSGSPGLMRAKIHPIIETKGMDIENKEDVKKLNEQTRQIIYNQLVEDLKKSTN